MSVSAGGSSCTWEPTASSRGHHFLGQLVCGSCKRCCTLCNAHLVRSLTQDREPFVVPDNVAWPTFADSLNRYFTQQTGKGLTQKNLDYLARRLMSIQNRKILWCALLVECSCLTIQLVELIMIVIPVSLWWLDKLCSRCVCLSVHACVLVCIYTCPCVCMHTLACMHMCVFVYLCVHT